MQKDRSNITRAGLAAGCWRALRVHRLRAGWWVREQAYLGYRPKKDRYPDNSYRNPFENVRRLGQVGRPEPEIRLDAVHPLVEGRRHRHGQHQPDPPERRSDHWRREQGAAQAASGCEKIGRSATGGQHCAYARTGSGKW